MSYTNFRPQTHVLVRTWRGSVRKNVEYTLTGDLVSWQTQKSLSQPQGTFAITLTANKHNGLDWSQIVKPMDYVEIRASSTGRLTSKGEYPIIMRGFVDSVTKNTAFGAQGGPTEPRIYIQGRD